jgi:hypothetical protein
MKWDFVFRQKSVYLREKKNMIYFCRHPKNDLQPMKSGWAIGCYEEVHLN